MQSVGIDIRITGTCSAVKYCTKSVFPQSRTHHAACQHESWIYILAGKDGNITLKDFWRLNLGNLTWEKLNYRGDIPQHLQGHTLLSFKKLLLLFGGEFGDALTESSLWIINPDLGYVRKASLDIRSECPCIRRYHSAVIYKDSMYMYGGYVDVKGSSSEFWRYDVEDEEWELLLPHQHSHDLPGRRYGHSAVIHKQSMWLYGGMNNLVPKQDLWCYSLTSERWERVKSKIGPPPLTGHAASVVGSQMIIYGGETNRESVNQVWSFSFETMKWTQIIFMGPEPPSKALHISVLVKPFERSEVTIKARSTPFLQSKAKEPVKRPQSSPGYRIQSESVQSGNQKVLVFERTNSAIENDSESKRESVDSCSICQNQMSYRRSISNIESFIHPSPSENSHDVIPLVSSETDINYNDTYMLDKDAILKGLDNPGISDSTEKLIEEGSLYSVFGQDCYLSSRKSGDIELNGAEKRKVCRECVFSAKTKSLNKRYKLDPDLIIEDLEFQDCFPYNIQVPFPSSNQISLQKSYRDQDNLETVELQDYFHGNNADCNYNCPGVLSPTDVKHNNPKEVCPTVRKQSSPRVLSPTDCKLNSPRELSEAANLSFSPVDNSNSIKKDIFCVIEQHSQVPKMKTNYDENIQEMETSFQQPESHPVKIKHTTRERKSTSAQKMDVNDRPYLMVIGGKDNKSVNFSVKPISVMKMQFSMS